VRAHQPDGADDFALAYAGLADTYVVMGGNGQKPLAEVVPRAKAALARLWNSIRILPKLMPRWLCCTQKYRGNAVDLSQSSAGPLS